MLQPRSSTVVCFRGYEIAHGLMGAIESLDLVSSESIALLVFIQNYLIAVCVQK